MITRICEYCGKKFKVHEYRVANGRGKFCSCKCSASGRKRTPRVDYVEISEERLRQLYVVEGLTQRQLAQIFGCGQGTIFNRMKEYKIQPRTNSETSKGRIPWNKNKKLGEEYSHMGFQKGHPMYFSFEGKRHTEESKKKMSNSIIKGYEDGRKSWNAGLTKDDERVKRHVEKSGRTLKKMYDNGEIEVWNKGKKLSEEHIRNILKVRYIKPNKAEQKLDDLLQRVVPNEFKYVGDGSFILGGKCPDFLNVNGKKQLVELFGDYFHRGDDPQDRIDYFRQFGFDTLVVWEHELEDELLLVERIRTWNGGN